MGAGAGGLGAFAMQIGRVAIQVVQRYILPVAKQRGKKLLEAAIREMVRFWLVRRDPVARC